MRTATLPVITEDSGLSRYLRQIKAFPMLSAEEEYMLAKRFHEHGDTDSAHKLVTSHLRLVAKIAMQFRGYGLPVSDLISEGNIGLMKAVKKFEPERGFRLATYAMWWIKAAVTEYILKSWSLVKLGTMSAQKKLFFSLRKAKGKLEILDNGELTPEDATRLAVQLNVSEGDLMHLNRRLAARDFSLNAPVGGEEESIEFQDTLVDEGQDPEAIVANREESDKRDSLIQTALAALPERERHILSERRLRDDPVTLEDLGKEYGISRERVRQLEVRAFEKVQNAILEATGHAE